MEAKKVNRRNFFRWSATAGASALLFPNAAASAGSVLSGSGMNNGFSTRILGRTGLEVPILSMGVMRADNPNVVKAAYQAGVTFFDTAHGYQGGRNEAMLGKFFSDKPRDSFKIATKGKFDYPLGENFEKEFTALLDKSLERLQTDYVDIFYIHAIGDLESIGNERVIRLLQTFRQDGKIRHIGISTHAHKPEQIDAAISAGIYDVVLLSYNFKLPNLKETDEAIERGVRAGLGFVAMKTMTGGVEDAEGKKKIDARACLKWVWQNRNIATVIPGFTSFTEFDECLEAVRQPELTAAEKQYLAMLCHRELLYCLQCGKCREACVEHLPIPDMMRAYMYAYGYRNAGLAKETLLELNPAEKTCRRCGTHCRVKCTSGFDVPAKIAAILPLMQVPDVFLT
ncbi:MAG: aldo/keto reductase [Tannerella sp.]|nr:aldo/keto reductase [Tannerella sp.]